MMKWKLLHSAARSDDGPLIPLIYRRGFYPVELLLWRSDCLPVCQSLHLSVLRFIGPLPLSALLIFLSVAFRL